MSTESTDFKFFSKVYELPLVKSVVTVANDRYNNLKNSNGVIRNALESAEKTVVVVADKAKPFVKPWESTLRVADSYAADTVDKIKERYPASQMTAEDLYNNGWKKVEDLKQAGAEKVTELKEYGYKKVDDVLSTNYATAVVHTVNSAIDMTEHAINHYLPPAEGEEQQKIEGNVFQKVSALSDITRRRLYQQALQQVKRIENARETTLAPVVNYAKEWRDYGYNKAVENYDAAKNYAVHVWEEVKKADFHQNEMVLSVARGLNQQAIWAYEEMLKATDRLPEGVKKSYSAGVTYTKDVYNELAKADNLKDASQIVLNHLYTGAQSATQYTIDALAPYVPQLQKFQTKEKSE
ncbi:perilipin-2-like protein [Leptotrombidium deliense]|uniref:Perilipin-2-like protein n=1 Tax=Leptotrombidium deliense TaxID=299467 RepID=A0A443S765_9ACAR|nr:perilipin-2-like protein [Leptotrombidium deliense]